MTSSEAINLMSLLLRSSLMEPQMSCVSLWAWPCPASSVVSVSSGGCLSSARAVEVYSSPSSSGLLLWPHILSSGWFSVPSAAAESYYCREGEGREEDYGYEETSLFSSP